jgi:hypothetical protein
MYESQVPHYPLPSSAWPTPPGGYYPPAPHRSPFAVASFILSVVAVIGVLVLAVTSVATGGALLGGPGETLTGQLAPLAAPPKLPGAALDQVVTDVINRSGGDASGMTCPDTPAVAQGVVTVCHGFIDDDGWAVVVFFEDAAGRFTLQTL